MKGEESEVFPAFGWWGVCPVLLNSADQCSAIFLIDFQGVDSLSFQVRFPGSDMRSLWGMESG